MTTVAPLRSKLQALQSAFDQAWSQWSAEHVPGDGWALKRLGIYSQYVLAVFVRGEEQKEFRMDNDEAGALGRSEKVAFRNYVKDQCRKNGITANVAHAEQGIRAGQGDRDAWDDAVPRRMPAWVKLAKGQRRRIRSTILEPEDIVAEALIRMVKTMNKHEDGRLHPHQDVFSMVDHNLSRARADRKKPRQLRRSVTLDPDTLPAPEVDSPLIQDDMSLRLKRVFGVARERMTDNQKKIFDLLVQYSASDERAIQTTIARELKCTSENIRQAIDRIVGHVARAARSLGEGYEDISSAMDYLARANHHQGRS